MINANKLVLVRWSDIITAHEWMGSDEEIQDFANSKKGYMESVGFVIEETKDRVIIAPTRHMGGEAVAGVIVIPHPIEVIPLSEYYGDFEESSD